MHVVANDKISFLKAEYKSPRYVCAQSLSHISVQPHGLQPARLLCLRGFSRQEYWSGLPFSFSTSIHVRE